ncbi:MAG TPA: hypothetical protein VKE74_04100 [Gemmataceae bacterium]|nr:hypothetical protein [Gemmataceae bacterium]
MDPVESAAPSSGTGSFWARLVAWARRNPAVASLLMANVLFLLATLAMTVVSAVRLQ